MFFFGFGLGTLSASSAAVFRIHNILVWIRIRGSMPLTNGSGSCYFRHRPSRCQQKTNFLFNFFCLLLFEDTFTFFSKIKSQKESQNISNQGYSYYFCMMIEGSRSGFVSFWACGILPSTSKKIKKNLDFYTCVTS
jgi:hypothetical protein